MQNKKALNALFYGLTGLASALALLLVFYLILRIDSNAGFLIDHTGVSATYSFFYIALALGTSILFGINISLLTYRFRKYGLNFKNQGGAGVGAILGIFASACPVCGSTLFSLIGVTGGLTALPFKGLELKTLAFIFMMVPIFLTLREIRNFDCGKIHSTSSVSAICPKPKNTSYDHGKDAPYMALATLVIFFSIFLGWQKLKSDPLIAKVAPNYYNGTGTAEAYSCIK
ncbi:MAG: hypothetical protein V4439_00590 [Patescibacteria group bacterium]